MRIEAAPSLAVELHRAHVARLAYREGLAKELTAKRRETAIVIRETDEARAQAILREFEFHATVEPYFPRMREPLENCRAAMEIVGRLAIFAGVSLSQIRTGNKKTHREARQLAAWIILAARPDYFPEDVAELFQCSAFVTENDVKRVGRLLIAGALTMPRWALDMIERSRALEPGKGSP